jgi:hypothetical protein
VAASRPTTGQDRAAQPFFFVLAVALLGQALATSNGHQNPDAMRLLTFTIALTVAGVLTPRFASAQRWFQTATVALLAVGFIWQFAMLAHNPPGIYLQPRTGWQTLFFLLGVSTAAVLAGAGLTDQPLLGRWRMPALLLTHFLLGCWLINASPHPAIDVDVIQRESATALLHGRNPFELTFQNIYGSTAFFGSAIADATTIKVGYPYPPLSLLLALPGHILGGDYRYSQLAAMVGSAALMAYARPGKLGPAIATLFLFTPRVFFVLEQGWTDPFLVLLASAVVFSALRVPRLTPWLFGLLVVVKQYAAVVVLFSWLLVRPFDWRTFARNALKAAAVATAVTLPFLLWNPQRFMFSVAGGAGSPFRPDALSFPAWLNVAHDQKWSLLSLGAIGVALLVAVARTSRTPSGFAAALALLYFGFFAFGGHAFCNHYYFILGLLSLAAATADTSPDSTAPST